MHVARTDTDSLSPKDLMQSSAIATLFVPKLGYSEVARLVQTSSLARRPFIELAVEHGLLTHEEVLHVLRESTDCRDLAA